MLSATITPVNVGGGAIIRIVGAQGPITLTRYDPQYSNTYTLLDGVPDVPVYIDMGDMAPEPLQSGVGYVYSLSDTVTTIQFTLVLPSAPVIGATYDNLIHMLQRIAEATIQNINFPRSPSGAQDPIKKAQIYIQPPMSENIKYPAIFINQEMLRMEEVPVGVTNQGQQIEFGGSTGLYRRVFSFRVIDTNSVTCNFYHDVLFAMSLSVLSDIFGDESLQESVHFGVQSTGGIIQGEAQPFFYMNQILLTIKGPLNLMLNPVSVGLTKSINVTINSNGVYPITNNLVFDVSVVPYTQN